MRKEERDVAARGTAGRGWRRRGFRVRFCEEGGFVGWLARWAGGTSGRYRAYWWERAMPVPAHVPRVRPRHGLLSRAGLGLGQKNGPRAGLTGSGCMAIYSFKDSKELEVIK